MRASRDASTYVHGFTVSVVIAAYADEHWEHLVRAIDSVRAQSLPVHETILVIDHNAALFKRARERFDDVTVIENVQARGASGARNSGIEISTGDILAFLDDDAAADPEWLARSVAHLGDANVVGTGGKLVPLWESGRPRWFPEEFLWTVGATYRGMPTAAAPVRNVWGGNMVVRAAACERVGAFRVEFGKRGDREDFQAEDTEFCLRAARAWPGTWMYEPLAIAGHTVPARRTSWRFVVGRCYHEGRNKVIMAHVSGEDATTRERRYVTRVIPIGVLMGLRDTARGDVGGLLRSATLVSGAAAAVFGAVSARREHGRPVVARN